MQICDLNQNKIIDKVDHLHGCRGMWCDSSVVIAGTVNGEVAAFDRRGNNLQHALWRLTAPQHTDIISGLAFVDGRLLTVGWDRALVEWTPVHSDS